MKNSFDMFPAVHGNDGIVVLPLVPPVSSIIDLVSLGRPTSTHSAQTTLARAHPLPQRLLPTRDYAVHYNLGQRASSA